jgi:hypothetical protein
MVVSLRRHLIKLRCHGRIMCLLFQVILKVLYQCMGIKLVENLQNNCVRLWYPPNTVLDLLLPNLKPVPLPPPHTIFWLNFFIPSYHISSIYANIQRMDLLSLQPFQILNIYPNTTHSLECQAWYMACFNMDNAASCRI